MWTAIRDSMNTALFGVAIGLILGEALYFLREKRNEKKLIKSVRFLIQTEIDHNKEVLQEYWDRIKPKSDRGNSKAAIALTSMRKTSFYTISDKFFECQAGHFAIALSDNEISPIIDFYGSFNSIKNLYSHIKNLGFATKSEHVTEASDNYYLLEKEINKVLAVGNPIQ